MTSYDYATRKGVRPISWAEFAAMTARLAESLAREGIEAVVGIARGGLFPATAVACALRRELYPVRVTRRRNDVVTYDSPVWITPVPPRVKGQVVAIVDEISDTGATVAMVAEAAREAGASRIVTAVLVSHTWATPAPDLTTLVTDELVIFPWDNQVLVAGRWQPHPEIMAGRAKQGRGSP